MPSVNRPLKREISRLGPISPEVDSILNNMYEVLDDPTYDGDPVETLLRIDEILGEHDSRCKFEQHPILEETEPDPGLFPEDTGFDITALYTPEALNAEPFNSFNSSAYLQRMMHGGPASRKLAQEPSFSAVLKRVESFLAKSPDLGVEAVAGGSEDKPRWVRRKLEPTKKKVDRKPKRLGPQGTWVNDPDDEGDRTQTAVQRRSTITLLQRQSTLTE